MGESAALRALMEETRKRGVEGTPAMPDAQERLEIVADAIDRTIAGGTIDESDKEAATMLARAGLLDNDLRVRRVGETREFSERAGLVFSIELFRFVTPDDPE